MQGFLLEWLGLVADEAFHGPILHFVLDLGGTIALFIGYGKGHCVSLAHPRGFFFVLAMVMVMAMVAFVAIFIYPRLHFSRELTDSATSVSKIITPYRLNTWTGLVQF